MCARLNVMRSLIQMHKAEQITPEMESKRGPSGQQVGL